MKNATKRRGRRLNPELIGALPIGELLPVEEFRIVKDANAEGLPPGYGIEVVILDSNLPQAIRETDEVENPRRKRTAKRKTARRRR